MGNKITTALAKFLATIEAFDKLPCRGETTCPKAVVAIVITLTTKEDEYAIGAYCIAHIALLSVYGSAAEEEEDST